MLDSVFIDEVIGKCELLKRSAMWPSEPRMRPRAWLNNFDQEDRALAASLLNRFTYCNSMVVDSLLRASWGGLLDGMPKGPCAPVSSRIQAGLADAVFTPVEGENPNRTDSGNLMCRKARQVLQVADENVMDPLDALKAAKDGKTVIFIDDFVGSGDQFLSTWRRAYDELGGDSFQSVHSDVGFTAIYITLVTTDFGLKNIHDEAPNVAVCPTHIIEPKSTLSGLIGEGLLDGEKVENLLSKYVDRLTPKEDYIADYLPYKLYGYKRRGLLLGFEHSIPDATLPIFWSPGIGDWEPLIERV